MPSDQDKKSAPGDIAKRMRSKKGASAPKIDVASKAKSLGEKVARKGSKKTADYDWYASAKERFSITAKRTVD